MARRTKRDIMDGVDCTESKLIDHSTVEYLRVDGTRVVRLHKTDIVTVRTDGTVVLNSGGWNTVTTRDRINDQLEKHCPGWRMWSEKNQPYLGWGGWSDPDRKVYHFHDGITIDCDTCDGERYDKDQVKLAAKHDRKLKAFSKRYIEKLTAGLVPQPSGGDCWYCCMVDQDGVSWGEHGNSDHLYHHVVENYYVPSLMLRAIHAYPVSMAAEQLLAYLWNNPQNLSVPEFYRGIGSEQLQKSLYRYLLHFAPYQKGVMEAIEAQHKAELEELCEVL